MGFEPLAQAFKSGVDFHQVNADTWGCTRQQAKTLLYAILYGAGTGKIAAQLETTKGEAEGLMEGVYASMPIKDLQDKVWGACKHREGYVFTVTGRLLYYPHINSKDFGKKKRAERQVFNALLQGGAADILKILTLRVLPTAHKLGAYLGASIHDELLFYCPKGNTDALAAHLTSKFTDTSLLSHCPITGSAKIGETWYDVH